MPAVKSVLVVGGGIAGLTAAVALRKQGIACRVVESGKPSDRLGTGIMLLGNTLRALDMLDLADPCIAAGYSYETVAWRDATGKPQSEQRIPNLFGSGRAANVGIMRPVLGDLLEAAALKGGATINYSTTVSALEQTGSSVKVRLSTGEQVETDLVVGADGVYSKTRSLVFGQEFTPQYCGQGVWRYTTLRAANLSGMTFYRVPQGSAIGGLPLSETHCYYFLLVNEPTQTHKPKDRLVEMFKERCAPFTAPELLEAWERLEPNSLVSYRPFEVLLMPEPWYRGRVLLIGDAAHTFTPQLTSGGGMAIEDAVVLAQELATQSLVAEALTRFMFRRGERVKNIFETSYAISRNELGARDDDLVRSLLRRGYEILGAPI